MTRKATRRKYRPVNPRAFETVIHDSQPTIPSEVARIITMIRLSYEKLKVGNGTSDDYDWVGAVVNVGLIRAEAIDPQLVDMFKNAGEAMLECERLRQRHGAYGFTGPHILVMNAAVDLYEQLLALSTPNQMHAAAQESYRRVSTGDYITA